MLYKQLNLHFFSSNQCFRQLAWNQSTHSITTKTKKKIKKNIFHFKKFKHDFLLIVIFKCLILFWINNYYYACIKKILRHASKQLEFFAKHDFSFEIFYTETCHNQKNNLIIHSFHLIFTLTIIGHNALIKKNWLNDNIFEFHNHHKILLYKKIELFVIEKFKHNV